jgi:hypothetical protein
MAKKKCRSATIVVTSPPRTYVEEDLSITLPADFFESQMFVVPDNWDPPTSFRHMPIAPNLGNSPEAAITPSVTYAACLVEEEPPDSIAREQT